MKKILFIIMLSGCAHVPLGAKLLCKQTCDTWGHGRPGPIMSVTDERTCACQSADTADHAAPAFHTEPLPVSPPLVGS